MLPEAHDFWFAFWELSTDRQVGQSVGPVPNSSIARYAARMGYDPDESVAFQGAIRAMDKVFREHLAKLAKRARDKGTQSEPDVVHSSRPLNTKLFDSLL